jgi:hypothetical protein
MPGRGIVAAAVPQQGGDGRGPDYLVGVGADRIKGRGKRGDFVTWPYIVDPRRQNTLVGLDLARDAHWFTCNLVLDPGKTVRGTVVDPDGRPLVGVEVSGTSVYLSAPQRPLTTPQFSLPAVDLSRSQPFFFTHREKKLGAVVRFKRDKTEGVTVKLQPLGVITGRLLDLDGEPLAGSSLLGYVEDGQPGIERGWYNFFSATAGKDGRFRAEVVPGVKVGARLWVEPTRVGDRVFEKLTLKPGQVHDVGDVKVDPRPE